MTDAFNWVLANQVALLAVLGGIASVLATVKQLVKPTGRKATVLDVLIDLFSWKPALGHTGPWGLPFAIPGIPSIDKGARAMFLSIKAAHAVRAANPGEEHAGKTIEGKSILLLPLVMLFGVSSCITAKKVAVDIGACAGAEVQKEVANLLPAVTAIISGGAVDWSEQLTALEQIGVPFVVCAVSAVVSDLQHKMPAPPVKGQVDPKLLESMVRAQTYLALHGVKL